MNRRAATGVLAAAAAIASLTGAPALAAEERGIPVGVWRDGSVSGFAENDAYRLDASCSVNAIAPLLPRVWRTYDAVAYATPKRVGDTARLTTVSCRLYNTEQAYAARSVRPGSVSFMYGPANEYGAGKDTWSTRLPLTICVSGEVELSSGRLVLAETCTTLPPWSPAVWPVP